MSRISRHALVLALLLTSTSALAADQWVKARTVLNTCGYFSTSQAEITFSYRNNDLPWGTSVYLIYGWGGTSGTTPFDWSPQPTTVEAPATAPYHWGTTVVGVIRARSSMPQYTNINYVWKVVLPDGHTFYEKGNDSIYGYYAADFSQVPMPCTNTSGAFIGTPTPLAITTVVKN
jgi:hypothetical protein